MRGQRREERERERDLIKTANSVGLVDLFDAVQQAVELSFVLALADVRAEARSRKIERVNK